MPQFIATTATKKLVGMDRRIRLIAGGMRASKTISILLYLITQAQLDSEATLTSVVSESFPHLRRGAMRDFVNIMQSHNYFEDERWNKSESTYIFPLRDPKTNQMKAWEGSKIEFFSADQPSKVRGPSRDRLFVNEVNNIPQEAWEQLLFRTREFAFGDWNPVSDFYMYEDYGLHDEADPYANDNRVNFDIFTYKDNEALEPAIIDDIVRKSKVNVNWGKVYAEGRRGDMMGKIFSNWKIIDEVPHEARLEVRGLDYGYARDPSALCDIYRYNGGFIIDELLSRVGIKNRQIADLILNQPDPNVLTVADSAEQKSIAEMQEYGCNIIGVVKRGGIGAISGSKETFTNSAIQFVQAQQMSITRRSLNYLKSYRNFMWQTDKDGKVIPKYDHFMSDEMMSVVYGMTNFSARERDDSREPAMTGNLSSLWGGYE